MSAEAVIVAGEASESDEEEIVHLSTVSRWVFLVYWGWQFCSICIHFTPRDHAQKEGEGRRLSIGSLGVAGIAGISLSSVTATVGSVGKQIGAISGLDIQAQARCSLVIKEFAQLHSTCKTINGSRSYVTCAKQFNYRGTNNSNLVQHPTVLHRKLYELNVQIHLGIQQYFEVWIYE